MKLLTTIAAALGLIGLATIQAIAQQQNFPPVIDRPDVQVSPLSINSTEDDFAPVILRGGELLIFTSSRSGPFGGSGTQRIWVASKAPNGWSSPASTSEA